MTKKTTNPNKQTKTKTIQALATTLYSLQVDKLISLGDGGVHDVAGRAIVIHAGEVSSPFVFVEPWCLGNVLVNPATPLIPMAGPVFTYSHM